MRYFIYLDKNFIKSLFSCILDFNFDIDVVEFSVQKGESITSDVMINPSTSKLNEEKKQFENKKGKEIECKNENRDNLNFKVSETKTNNSQVQRKYINISEVSDIKNLSFYNKLLDKLIEGEYKNIIKIKGNINICKLRNISSNEDKFVYIDNCYIWLDNNLLNSNLEVLCNIVSEVNIVGFIVNKLDNFNIIKAIAIYID
jgi:hypothetical protein